MVLDTDEPGTTQAQTDADELEQEDDDDAASPPNQGQLIIDASCAPADIRYPTDLSLLNQAHEETEAILEAIAFQATRQGRIEQRIASHLIT
ncbi:hypothetical protein [Leptodesmis sichuanensis]|uniref:hypothetical protein n=1 Tax=Leptodesmis sichuanensis TaxID=2906798 RepID=UPI001F20C686|nr:hypothetical protein [Leptodesmis sichuanensis]UIE40725.1 hypothetical protein KIK02_17145 [Leptodesmis sichuanensis A121]